ncbi:MAG: thioredoxin domain-containing protein [Lachnospiraceae bacterium]|nr:thioredoxin domain-containing protein [Lachnospiraceae bacterium]
MQNRLKDQTSPYLLQHAENPVDWYPWCDEAFARARAEDKPVFLSIGYSTCHWCHVMAHESFEDQEVAALLNQYFISIKVDKEERPDIDSIYMAVCQAFTGSGGWPTTVFLTPDQKPFFAGTYFPKTARYGQPGLKELLLAVHESWTVNREGLLKSAEDIIAHLSGASAPAGSVDLRLRQKSDSKGSVGLHLSQGEDSTGRMESPLIRQAVEYFKRTFDGEYGGFGGYRKEPKFPTPHNLLFLMRYYKESKDREALKMAEKTLLQMYRGGMFDHIGGGFCRYSTDRYFLVPHFEKMLYDNALLILAYCKAYQITKNKLYRDVAEKTAAYVLREMTSAAGGFYSAQDADSEGVEGKYYLLEPAEIIGILGVRAGSEFNAYFDITEEGNFEGKSIPNRLKRHEIGGETGDNGDDRIGSGNPDGFSDGSAENITACLQTVYEYRRQRYALHLDDKILTAWNGLMIAAMCRLYRVTADSAYLDAALNAQKFIRENLCEQDTLYVSWRDGKRSGKGFLDDYAFEIFALLELYGATLESSYLDDACRFCGKAINEFYDEVSGGFFLYGRDGEQLIIRPKETYDGAVFSGNSAMAYNLVQLYLITGDERFGERAEDQLQFMSGEAADYPAGHAMFLIALSDYLDVPDKITVVPKDERDLAGLSCKIPLDTVINVLDGPTEEYPLKNDRTTFYVCRGRSCQPPVNELGL